MTSGEPDYITAVISFNPGYWKQAILC